MEQLLTISIFTKNNPGLLHRVTTVFTKRKLNIESITASESEVEGTHRYTILLKTDLDTANKVVSNLEKQVEVYKAFVHTEDQTVYQEIALYKVPTNALMQNKEVEQIVRKYNARILTFEPEFAVIEKTGHPNETKELYDELSKYEILEFVRSGRVAITKPMKTLSEFLMEMWKRETWNVKRRDVPGGTSK